MQSDPFLRDTIDHLGWPNRLRLIWRLFQDGRVSPWAKRLLPLGALAYFVMPFDVIPDFFVGAGQVDDLGVVAVFALVLVNLLVKLAPAEVVAEHLVAMGVRLQPAHHPRGNDPYVEAKFRRK